MLIDEQATRKAVGHSRKSDGDGVVDTTAPFERWHEDSDVDAAVLGEYADAPGVARQQLVGRPVSTTADVTEVLAINELHISVGSIVAFLRRRR